MSPTIPRLPLVPDVLRRIRVPRDLESVTATGDEAHASAGGLTDEQVEQIWKAALSLYRSGVHPAVALCVRRNGHVVLDRAVGHTRGNGPQDSPDVEKVAATPATPMCIFSASKAITAMVVHLLDERGALHISDRVSDYIPEYAAHGKEAITIGHVLAHRAGVARIPSDAMDLDRVNDREFLLHLICDVKPTSRPGKTLAYHAVSGGFILGEVVHRATGQSIRDVLAQEILDPLGFRWGNYGVAPEDVSQVTPSYVTGAPLLPPISNLVTRVLSQPIDKVVELSNDPRFLTGIVPAANVVTTANELSRFFELFRAGGELDGTRIMDLRTIRRALTEQSHMEVDLSLGYPTRFSYGLMLGSQRVSLFGRDTQQAFGHLGLINIMGWADAARGVSCALLTSGKAILYPEIARFYGVMSKIASTVPKVPASEILI